MAMSRGFNLATNFPAFINRKSLQGLFYIVYAPTLKRIDFSECLVLSYFRKEDLP